MATKIAEATKYANESIKREIRFRFPGLTDYEIYTKFLTLCVLNGVSEGQMWADMMRAAVDADEQRGDDSRLNSGDYISEEILTKRAAQEFNLELNRMRLWNWRNNGTLTENTHFFSDASIGIIYNYSIVREVLADEAKKPQPAMRKPKQTRIAKRTRRAPLRD